VLVELGLVEQRYKAVCEVLDGATVVDVARRNQVVRQTVHDWLRRYAASGLAGLADRSSKPGTCPHQVLPAVEARILELRRAHPSWGPSSIVYELGRQGIDPLPGRSSVYRALVRHGLIDPKARKRRRQDYRRWERSRAMELWQMDVVGRLALSEGTELYVLTGIDDHSRFCVCAQLLARATARPICDALAKAMRTHGVPDAILTDNAKVFTARFGKGPGPVLFDRICVDNGIRHLLTAPRSPTTTGKVERFHKTLRGELLTPNQGAFATAQEAQAALDAWVEHYNCERPHQAIGMCPPLKRFALADRRSDAVEVAEDDAVPPARASSRPPGVGRWVDQRGKISLAGFSYRVGPTFAGEPVEVVTHDGLVEILHAGVLVATHVQRQRPGSPEKSRPPRTTGPRRLRRPTSGPTVQRVADNSGSVSFAGASYRAGRAWRGKSIDVAIVAGSVQLSVDNKVIRVHPIRHDRAKEHGAYATPKGRPRSPKTA
jgi:transposase InsO family protein